MAVPGIMQYGRLIPLLLIHVQLLMTPWTAAHQAPWSFTVSWSLLKFMFTGSVIPSNHLILYLPPSFVFNLPHIGRIEGYPIRVQGPLYLLQERLFIWLTSGWQNVSTGDICCFRIRFVNEATCPTAWYGGLISDIQHYIEEDQTQQHEEGTWVC